MASRIFEDHPGGFEMWGKISASVVFEKTWDVPIFRWDRCMMIYDIHAMI